jgi:hypothetical protein
MNFKALDEHYQRVATTKNIDEEQLAAVAKIVKLFKEAGETPDTTAYRHNAARAVLQRILEDVGDDAFFLCVFSYTITWLGSQKIRARSEFLQDVKVWWMRQRPLNLTKTRPQLMNGFPQSGTYRSI